MEAIRERCQRMRISELQTFLTQNPQYVTACNDIYIQKYKRLYATICTILVVVRENCTIRNLNFKGLDTTIAREGIAEWEQPPISLHEIIPEMSRFFANPEEYNIENDDGENEHGVLHLTTLKLRFYISEMQHCDIPNLENDIEIDTHQYFDFGPYLYCFFYDLIKYNDPPTFEEDEEEMVPLITQRVMEFV